MPLRCEDLELSKKKSPSDIFFRVTEAVFARGMKYGGSVIELEKFFTE